MTRKEHINKCLPPTQSRDNPANVFMFMCFSFPEILSSSVRPSHGTQGDYTAYLAIHVPWCWGGWWCPNPGTLHTHQKSSWGGASRFVSPGLAACLAAAHRKSHNFFQKKSCVMRRLKLSDFEHMFRSIFFSHPLECKLACSSPFHEEKRVFTSLAVTSLVIQT